MANVEEFEQYRAVESVQQEIGARLYALHNVTGSAVGYKVTAGRVTRQVCLVIFVNEKSALPADHPSMFLLREIESRGIATDVIERSNVTLPIPPVRINEPSLDKSRTDKTDPMIGGISCGPNVNIIKDGSSGTLGITVFRTDTNELGILSNQHVMYYDPATTTVCQPARVDSFWNYQAGDKLDSFKGDVSFEGKSTYVDCAVASVLPDRSATRKSVFGIAAPVTGIVKRSSVGLGDPVVKSGLSSNITRGTVKYLSAQGRGGKEPNQFAILGDNQANFSEPGDSGSVVLIGAEVMGLLWGENSDDHATYAMVTPIEAVLQKLRVEI